MEQVARHAQRGPSGPSLAPPTVSCRSFLTTAHLQEAMAMEIKVDEIALFHTGPGAMFPLVSAAVERVLPVRQLRWITFCHVESDECGSMNQWLAAAPGADVAHVRPDAWCR